MSEQRFEELVADIDGILWEADGRTFQFTFVSEGAERLLGYPREQWLASGFWRDHVHPGDRARVMASVLEAVTARRKLDFEYGMLAADGRIVRLRNIVSVRQDGVDRLRGIMVAVSEKRQVESELQRSNELLRAIIDAAPAAIIGLDRDGNVQHVWNPAAEQMLGWSAAEVIGRRLPSVPSEKTEEFAAFRRQVQRGQSLRGVEVVRQRRDGSPIEYSIHTAPLYDESGNIAGNVAILIDITERKRAERALLESHSLLKAVLEGTSDAIYLKDLQHRYLLINAAGARLLGKTVDEVVGKDDRDLFSVESVEAVVERDRQVTTSGESQTFEETVAATNGRPRTYLTTKSAYRDAHGQVVGLIGISRDITDLKRLEEQLRQAQKMEAIGRLAGGVAHDFNNLLTVINGYSELAYTELPAEDPNRRLIAEVHMAGERAADLTRQLLAFSRKQVLHSKVVDVNRLLADISKLLQRLIGEDVRLSLVPAPAVGPVRIDPGQFEQAIINLAVNARDAMPEGGRLIIETHDVELDDKFAASRADVRPGRYVLVAVCDSGRGMEEATKARVFEPFFTTKPLGKGTGLGLAMVYGLVKQSGGHVEVYSELGHGTVFKMYLPCTAEKSASVEPRAKAFDVGRGSETLLLVEDEDAVRKFCKYTLQAAGFTVLEARDGQEALGLAEQHQGPIHLLLTDLVMLHMGGRQLADRLAQARPELPVLFMSGYTHEAAELSVNLTAGAAFLQKPLSPTSLIKGVRELLDQSR